MSFDLGSLLVCLYCCLWICVSGSISPCVVSQPVFSSAATVLCQSPSMRPCASLSVSYLLWLSTVSIGCHRFSLFPCRGHRPRPCLGPGHPPEGASPLLDGPRHSQLLLCLHAPGLDAPQLDCLRLWTLVGQRHGKSWRIPTEARDWGWTAGAGRGVWAGPLVPLYQTPVSE